MEFERDDALATRTHTHAHSHAECIHIAVAKFAEIRGMLFM